MKIPRDRSPTVPDSLKDLDLQQMQFVTSFLELGGRPQDGVEAALRAGYGDGSTKAAKRCASVLLASPKITGAIQDAIRKRFDVAAAAAFNTLLEVCSNKAAPANARISAAQEILNRSSIGPVVSRSAVLKAETGIENLWAAIDLRKRQAAKQASEPQGSMIEGFAISSTDENGEPL